MKIPVVFSPEMISDTGLQPVPGGGPQSPSALKPAKMAKYLENRVLAENCCFEPVFIKPTPLDRSDFYLAHETKFVNNVMEQRTANGFGTFSQSVINSLPYTNGAMYTAATTATPEVPAVALVSGFHHAGYDTCKLGYFCTFNGLMVTAMKLLNEGRKKVAIIDADMHWGNGTDHILSHMSEETKKKIYHCSFGKHYSKPEHASDYLDAFKIVEKNIVTFKPDVIIYQSGADVHVNDPYGGVLTASQMFRRDYMMFQIAKNTGTPIAWDLAGGYQVAKDGSIEKVLRLHYNTFRACVSVYDKR